MIEHNNSIQLADIDAESLVEDDWRLSGFFDTPETIKELFSRLAGLQRLIPGISYFAGGAYASPEGLNQGYTQKENNLFFKDITNARSSN